jgi:hypothetical protein
MFKILSIPTIWKILLSTSQKNPTTQLKVRKC